MHLPYEHRDRQPIPREAGGRRSEAEGRVGVRPDCGVADTRRHGARKVWLTLNRERSSGSRRLRAGTPSSGRWPSWACGERCRSSAPRSATHMLRYRAIWGELPAVDNQPAVGSRFRLCLDLVRLVLHRVRHRRLCTADLHGSLKYGFHVLTKSCSRPEYAGHPSRRSVRVNRQSSGPAAHVRRVEGGTPRRPRARRPYLGRSVRW